MSLDSLARLTALRLAGDASDSPPPDFPAFIRRFAAAVSAFVCLHADPESTIPLFGRTDPEFASDLEQSDNFEVEEPELWNIHRALKAAGYTSTETVTSFGSLARLICCSVHSFAVPSRKAIEAIVKYAGNGRVVELGAGGGYWAHLVESRGIRIDCFDLEGMEPGVQEMNGTEEEGGDEEERLGSRFAWKAIHRGTPESVFVSEEAGNAGMLLLIWPPPLPNEMSLRALTLFKGRFVAYVGDRPDRRSDDPSTVAGTTEFHAALDNHWKLIEHVEIPRWVDGIGDSIWIFERG